MEDEKIQEISKYKFVKKQMEEYRDSAFKSLTIIDRVIPMLQKNGDSVCVNNYLKELKNIRENISINRSRIVNTLLPAIDEKLKELEKETLIGEEEL